MGSEVILTEDELRLKCREWQQILRLQDWDIEVNIKRHREIQGPSGDEEGRIRTNEDYKKGFIEILDPIDLDPARYAPLDMEEVLVHELLHIHFRFANDHDSCTCQLKQKEFAINMITEALVKLHRQNIPPK